jgi:hypothetical protein
MDDTTSTPRTAPRTGARSFALLGRVTLDEAAARSGLAGDGAELSQLLAAAGVAHTDRVELAELPASAGEPRPPVVRVITTGAQ